MVNKCDFEFNLASSSAGSRLLVCSKKVKMVVPYISVIYVMYIDKDEKLCWSTSIQFFQCLPTGVEI
jgi:hypothetical protein